MPFPQVPATLLRLGPDIGLLWLRVGASDLLFLTNGWPKIVGYSQELQHIDDPWGIGQAPTLWMALLAEVACPVAVALGWMTRLACLPIIVLLLVAMVLVHPACPRRPNFDHPFRLNNDQGWKAASSAAVCG